MEGEAVTPESYTAGVVRGNLVERIQIMKGNDGTECPSTPERNTRTNQANLFTRPVN